MSTRLLLKVFPGVNEPGPPHVRLDWQVSMKQAERENQRKDTSNRNIIMQ